MGNQRTIGRGQRTSRLTSALGLGGVFLVAAALAGLVASPVTGRVLSQVHVGSGATAPTVTTLPPSVIGPARGAEPDNGLLGGQPGQLAANAPGAAQETSEVTSRMDQLDHLDLPAGWSASIQQLTVSGISRFYLLVRPTATTGGSMPTIVALHGRDSTPADMERATDFPSLVGRALLVYPAGYDWSWNAGDCCGAAYEAHINDTAFLDAVVRNVLATQPQAVASRFYVAGFSAGGRMAYKLACDLPGVFAGVAAVEAVPVLPCARAAPVPVEVVAESDDPLLTVRQGAPEKVVDGFVEPTVDQTVAAWRQLDGCAGIPDQDVTATLTLTTWDSCSHAGRVQFALYVGGHHEWPAGDASTPPAQNLIWAFFRNLEPSIH